MSTSIYSLNEGLKALFRTVDHPQARQMSLSWPTPPVDVSNPSPSHLPVTSWLNEAQRNAPVSTADLVRNLAAAASDLRWQQTYSTDDFEQSFLDRYGWMLLVGPDAPMPSDALLSGFLILGPDVEYPVHQHSAKEVYVVLSGEASWKLGEEKWHSKPAGSVIYNPPWRPHGMRTDRGEPLLVGFMWKAGTVEKSKILPQNQT